MEKLESFCSVKRRLPLNAPMMQRHRFHPGIAMKRILSKPSGGLNHTELSHEWCHETGSPTWRLADRAASTVKQESLCRRKILVPVCLTEDSYASLALARSLAREPGVELMLLHVVQLNIAGEERGINRTGLVNDLCRDAESRLKVLAEGISGVVTTKVVHSTGRPAEAIVAAEKQMGADTIVLMKHAHNGWRRWMCHNTALHVIRQAPCTVWLVAPHKRHATSNVIADHPAPAAIHRNHIQYYENPNPSRSFLRVLFS